MRGINQAHNREVRNPENVERGTPRRTSQPFSHGYPAAFHTAGVDPSEKLGLRSSPPSTLRGGVAQRANSGDPKAFSARSTLAQARGKATQAAEGPVSSISPAVARFRHLQDHNAACPTSPLNSWGTTASSPVHRHSRPAGLSPAIVMVALPRAPDSPRFCEGSHPALTNRTIQLPILLHGPLGVGYREQGSGFSRASEGAGRTQIPQG